MDRSFLARKLRTRDELTTGQAKIAQAFLDNPEAAGVSEVAAEFRGASRTRLAVYGFPVPADDDDRFSLRDGQILDWLEMPMGLLLGPGEYFALQAPGSRMEPRIFPGETLVVRRNYPPARDKKCVIEFNDGTGVLKSYKGQHDGRVFAEQYNPNKAVDYDASSVKAIHAVAFSL